MWNAQEHSLVIVTMNLRRYASVPRDWQVHNNLGAQRKSAQANDIHLYHICKLGRQYIESYQGQNVRWDLFLKTHTSKWHGEE